MKFNQILPFIIFLEIVSLSSSIQIGGIKNPEISHTLSVIPFEKGPYVFENKLYLINDNLLYTLNRNGSIVERESTGFKIPKIKFQKFDGKDFVFIPANNFLYIYSGNKLYRKIDVNESIYNVYGFINNSKILISLNYPVLIDLNGSILWKRKDLEAREFALLGDNIIAGGGNIFSLDFKRNLNWVKNFNLMQPIRIFKNRIFIASYYDFVVLDENGNVLWKYPIRNIPSENSLIQFFDNSVAVAHSSKISIFDLNGNLIKEITTNVYPRIFRIKDIDNDGEKEFILGDDIGIYAFNVNGLEWKLIIRNMKNFDFLDVDSDNFIEIVAGSDDGVIVIDNKEIELKPYFDISRKKAMKGEKITFDASRSLPENVKFRWDFNSDGIFDTSWLDSSRIEHIYLEGGNYTVTLEISDGKRYANFSRKVIIFDENLAPQINISISPSAVRKGENITIFVRFYDREGDRVSFRYDFDGDGIFDSEWINNPSYEFKARKEGRFKAIVEVKDDYGNLVRKDVGYRVLKEKRDIESGRGYFKYLIILIALIFLTLIFIILKSVKKQTFKEHWEVFHSYQRLL